MRELAMSLLLLILANILQKTMMRQKMLYRTVILCVVQHVKVNQSRQYLCEDDGRLRE